MKTINEVRAEQGLAPVQGGDAPLVQSGNALVPLAQAAKGTPAPTSPSPLAGEGRGEGAKLAKYAPDQPRVPSGQSGGGRFTSGDGGGGNSDTTTSARSRTGVNAQPDNEGDISGSTAAAASHMIVAGNKAACIEECYFWIEMPEPVGQFGTRQWDFHRCVAECMARS